MTDSERITALEAELAALQSRIGDFKFDYFQFGMNDGGAWNAFALREERRVPFCWTRGRFSIMSKYQSELPWGEGCAFSVDSECDAGLAWFEFAPTSTANARPKFGIFVHVVGDNPQPNIAFHARVGGSRDRNVALLVEGAENKTGIEIGFGVLEFWIGRIGGVLKKLWP